MYLKKETVKRMNSHVNPPLKKKKKNILQGQYDFLNFLLLQCK